VFKEGPGILGWRAQEGTGKKSGIWLRARAGLAGRSSGSAGKTELTAWVPRVSGRGVTRRLRERAGRWAERGVRLAAGPCGASVGEAGEKALAGGPGLSGTARARTSGGSAPVRAWRVLRELGRGAAGPCGG